MTKEEEEEEEEEEDEEEDEEEEDEEEEDEEEQAVSQLQSRPARLVPAKSTARKLRTATIIADKRRHYDIRRHRHNNTSFHFLPLCRLGCFSLVLGMCRNKLESDLIST